MTITNLERVLSQLRRYGRGFYDGAVEQQRKEAEEVMRLARDVYCPIDTGRLRSTARVTAEVRELQSASVDIQFGGADSVAPYAAVVHEDRSKHHKSPTRAGYLADAVAERQPGMALRIDNAAVAAAKRRAR
jgi:hypothetical protein